ncbi:hypothetical protein JW879_01110 [candidate division WOR-3 bacterium]|nr:hypothetical protein [candidate division WOR-3 bacterium]
MTVCHGCRYHLLVPLILIIYHPSISFIITWFPDGAHLTVYPASDVVSLSLVVKSIIITR